MEIHFDPFKNVRNILERGLSFESAVDFDFESALVHVDARKNYPETRYVALGFLKNRLHVLCFSEVDEGIRVISFRKANLREVERYVSLKTSH